jgi:hypothetical protein
MVKSQLGKESISLLSNKFKDVHNLSNGIKSKKKTQMANTAKKIQYYIPEFLFKKFQEV